MVFMEIPYTKKIIKEFLTSSMKYSKRKLEKIERQLYADRSSHHFINKYSWLDSKNSVLCIIKAYLVTFQTDLFPSATNLEADNLILESINLIKFIEEVLVPEIIEAGGLQRVAYSTVSDFVKMAYEYLVIYQKWRALDVIRIGKLKEWSLIKLYNARKDVLPQDVDLINQFDVQICTVRASLEKFGGVAAVKRFDEKRSFEPEKCNPPLYFHNYHDDEGDYGGFSETVFTGTPTNEQTAHELLINPEFHLPDVSVSDHMSHRATSYRNFWDTLIKQLESNIYDMTIKVFHQIRHACVSYKPDLGDVLNLEEIKHLLQNERGLSWPDICKLTIETADIIQRVHDNTPRQLETCERLALIRAAMTPELPATDHIAEFSKALEISLERVRILDTDVANAHIRLIQPIICSDGHNYLLRIFEEKCTNMDRTKLLIQSVIQQQKQQSLNFSSSRTIILTHAVVRFVTATDADIIPFPETFQWDAHRFCDYKRWWSYIIRSMALITRLENEIPKTFAPQVNILARELGTAQFTIKKAVTSAFSTIIVEETVKTKIKYATLKAFNDEDPVYQLLDARFGHFLKETIKAINTDNSPPNINIPSNFHHITPLINHLASKLKNFIDVNERIYGPLYDKIMADQEASAST